MGVGSKKNKNSHLGQSSHKHSGSKSGSGQLNNDSSNENKKISTIELATYSSKKTHSNSFIIKYFKSQEKLKHPNTVIESSNSAVQERKSKSPEIKKSLMKKKNENVKPGAVWGESSIAIQFEHIIIGGGVAAGYAAREFVNQVS
eukprot:c21711_g2_i3.p1 GENE.c21711_g2_i3~~c21711_g2_i3.p1  ORF type:complete len:145 (-),score=35.02 c21711_g2_i3:36-470(-)